MMSDLKAWGGFSFLILVICVAIALFQIDRNSQENSNFQLVLQQCFLDKKTDSDICQSLLDFGVSPQMYVTDEYYRTIVDKRTIKQLEGNPAMVVELAELTLNRAGNMQVKLVAKSLQALEEKRALGK